MSKKNEVPMPKIARPLTGRRLRRETNAQSRLQFGGQQRQLRRERRASNLQGRRIDDWYDEYLRSIGRVGRETQGAYSQAGAGVRQQIGASSVYDEELRQRLRSEAQEDAALRGVNYDPATSELAVAASTQRRNLQDVFSGLIRTQGAGQRAYFSDKKRIGKASKIDQLLRERARGRSIDADLRALQGDKGAFKVDARRVARESERDFYLQRRAIEGKSDYQSFAERQQKRGIRAEIADDRRGRRAIRLQQQGGDGDKDRGKPGSRSDRRRAAAYLRRGDYNSRRGAVDYLINRGIAPNVARYVVKHAGGKGHGGGGGRGRGRPYRRPQPGVPRP